MKTGRALRRPHAKVVRTSFLCIKGDVGSRPGMAQSRTIQSVTRHRAHFDHVSGSQHLARFVPMATLPPAECPTAPASYVAACGPMGGTARTRTQSPFVMPSGDPGLVCPRSRYLDPSARDRGQRCKAPQVLLSVSCLTLSRKKLRACPGIHKPAMAMRPHKHRVAAERRPASTG
jgi:hypothetical protein